MSYDFDLYISGKKNLPDPPLLRVGNIQIDGPLHFEEEDVPKEYLPVIGKKRCVYQIHLEGEVERGDRPSVDEWLRRVIFETNGVLIDLQSEKFETRRKSGSMVSSEMQTAQTGSMTFFFQDGEDFFNQGFESMMSNISKVLPAAMPTRYGSYEPLQGKVQQGGYAEIVAAFHEGTDIFMKSPAPFGYIFMTIPCSKTFERYHPEHFILRHHLLGRVQLQFRSRVFSDHKIMNPLLDLFKILCVNLDVVYADILQFNERVDSWVWNGLPDRSSAHTICVGPAYQRVWPEVSVAGELIGDQHRVFTTDRFGSVPPRAPTELLAPDQKGRDLRRPAEYARIFPFDHRYG